MDWHLSEDRPIFQQLYEELCRRILTGRYPPGSRMPSVRELAAEAGVNPNTMQRALQQLDGAGLTESTRTDGRTVTADGTLTERMRRELFGEAAQRFFTEAAALGFSRAEAKDLILREEEHHE